MGMNCWQTLAAKDRNHMKVFIWTSVRGALPTSKKAGALCKGCNASIEIVHHLFQDCPCISFIGKAICRWIFEIWGVSMSKMQLFTAS